MHYQTPLLASFSLAALSAPAAAQRLDVSSPGSYGGGLGQTTRFDNEFNPALSFVIDMLADYTSESSGGEDGVDVNLRRLDLLVADWVDPNAFAWFTIAYEEQELALDEAAIEYVGLPGRNTLRAGRFFVDFGKQMQAHIEELRTIERPLVLRDFLGEELAGDGVQWDYWHGLGDTTLVRYSVGAFGSLAGGHHHGEEADPEPEVIVPTRKELDQLNFTARLTAMTEVGENGNLQLGGSTRLIPDFAFEYDPSELYQEGYSNSVFGLDATYGWRSDTGIKSFTTGFEYLWNTGDLEAEVNDAGTPGDPTDDALDVSNGTRMGYYGFVDCAFTQQDSTGVQYSRRQSSHVDKAERGELDFYYTRHLSEFLRLRAGATFATDEAGPDSTRFAIQLTSFVGPHGHGLSW
ncbi:MAG: hypothetical protein H6831_12790 [Planctomycetes bacterium]|nr:hypothetical protein [Planctomycetota bacterium]MCB9905277.1 hypothetical protein [Planctomycetota bacterium]